MKIEKRKLSSHTRLEYLVSEFKSSTLNLYFFYSNGFSSWRIFFFGLVPIYCITIQGFTLVQNRPEGAVGHFSFPQRLLDSNTKYGFKLD